MSRAPAFALASVLGVLGALGATARAGEPCDDGVLDPVATPVRDVAIDAQRSACLRDELSTHLLGHALIDTPGFHGVLGGDLRISGRMRIGARLELDATLRLVDATFVQNAVNKATDLTLGPATIGAAWADTLGAGAVVAVVGSLELPYTRDEQATAHASGELTAVVTARLAARTALHARLGALGAVAVSSGGDTERLAFRAGVDLARRLRRAVSFQVGAELQAGWYAAIDHVNLRAGVHWRFRGPWRGMVGAGFPVGGEERTNAVLDLGIIRDLR